MLKPVHISSETYQQPECTSPVLWTLRLLRFFLPRGCEALLRSLFFPLEASSFALLLLLLLLLLLQLLLLTLDFIFCQIFFIWAKGEEDKCVGEQASEIMWRICQATDNWLLLLKSSKDRNLTLYLSGQIIRRLKSVISQKSPRILTQSLLTAEVSINLYKCTLKRTNSIISDLKITPVEYANVVQADEKVSSAGGIDSSSKEKKNHEMN